MLLNISRLLSDVAHTQVRNFMPSVSSAISYSSHTVAVWCLLIVVHCPFRFQLARRLNDTYKLLLAQIFTPTYLVTLTHAEFAEFVRLRRCLYASYALNRLEIVGLLTLSIFNSNLNYGTLIIHPLIHLIISLISSRYLIIYLSIWSKDLHKLGFVIYLLCGASFKVLVCLVEMRLRRESALNQYDGRKRLAVIFISCFVVCMCLYKWHNSSCQNYS